MFKNVKPEIFDASLYNYPKNIRQSSNYTIPLIYLASLKMADAATSYETFEFDGGYGIIAFTNNSNIPIKRSGDFWRIKIKELSHIEVYEDVEYIEKEGKELYKICVKFVDKDGTTYESLAHFKEYATDDDYLDFTILTVSEDAISKFSEYSIKFLNLIKKS